MSLPFPLKSSPLPTASVCLSRYNQQIAEINLLCVLTSHVSL